MFGVIVAPMTLADVPLHTRVVVTGVEAVDARDVIARRLGELGFVPGEAVEVRATGPLGREPLLVHIGYTRFALRRAEAARVHVIPEASP